MRPRDGEAEAATLARVAVAPEVQAAMIVRAYTGVPKDDLTMDALIGELAKQGVAGSAGDLAQGERMLVAQAHALDAIFGECARRARANMGEYTQTAELYLRVGLRAQSQCRATWETLAAIKNPSPVAFVRQANFAAGPQQVNNGVSVSSRAREQAMTPNKLLEADNDTRMDTRTTSAAGESDQALAAMGTLDRPEDCGR